MFTYLSIAFKAVEPTLSCSRVVSLSILIYCCGIRFGVDLVTILDDPAIPA